MPTAKPKLELSVIDMHTGGEPLRIVPNFPFEVKGASILVKRKYFRENYDHIRKFLMHEPRGHADMYGAVVVESEQAHLGVLFMDNEGYGTFCGHGTIALARWAVDSGKIERSSRAETRVDIECPAAVVKAFLCNVTGRVRFVSMPAFSHSDEVKCKVSLGQETLSVTADIAYGGTFYAFVEAKSVELDLEHFDVGRSKVIAASLKAELRKTVKLEHPLGEDVEFLYGIIFVDDGLPGHADTVSQVCVFADGQVDRSPCGSGVTARMAHLHHTGHAQMGTTMDFYCPIGNSTFTGKLVEELNFHGRPAVRVEVAGKAHYSGTAAFTAEHDDPTFPGFLFTS